MNLLQRIRVFLSNTAAVAGTSDINGDGFDLSADGGYDGVLFILVVGTLTATQVTTLKAQQSSDDGSGDAYADIAGSQSAALADDDDDQIVVLDIFQPGEKWVRPVLERGTANAVLNAIVAIGYRSHSKPTTQEAVTVSSSAGLFQPVAGTA